MEKRTLARWRGAWLAAGLLALAPHAAAQDPAFTPAATLRPFASEADLLAWFEPFAAERRRQEELRRQRQEEARRREEENRRGWEAANPGKTWERDRLAVPAPTYAPAPAPPQSKVAESITNTQVAGVDEGGIVKVHGKHLVILRRGRLFTVDVGRQQLAPVAAVDAFGPEVSGQGGWYDEMLVAGDTVAVIGYSYARGGTELVLFGIDDAGKLAYRGTWHLKSQDYYSSRNYASRLIGSKLVLYTPIAIRQGDADPLARLPALRRWQQGAVPADFKPITPPTRIYRTDEALDPQAHSVTLHAVVTCDLAQPELRCESSGVLGAAGRVFHVSPTAVYVWALQSRGPQASAAVFRLPLDGAAPSALKTQGSPIDQFSFLEQPDGHLNVLVAANGKGDGMWRGELAGGNLSLLRVRVRDFGDGSTGARQADYRPLPPSDHGSVQNRYVGGHLLYGAGTGWHRPGPMLQTDLQVVDLKRGKVQAVRLPHGVDRIEALGAGAVAVGSDGSDLHFSSVRLGARPATAGRYTLAGAAQGETRSHGFFYKPENASTGILGLPVQGNRVGADRQLWGAPAAMVYLRNRNLRLTDLGALPAYANVGRQDNCIASCVDWYGNARPIFLGGRMFALMGYELVEGQLRRGPDGARRVQELRRISFAPGSPSYQP